VVASTQADLGELVSRHRFREDLYHRLRVTRIGLPPLRERRADIPLLAAHFVASLAVETGLAPVEFQAAELEALEQHDWPGNVRQLRETVEQTLLRGQLPADALAGSGQHDAVTPDYPLDWTLEQVKRHHMACVLEACDGNKSEAARRLDISRKTLDRKLGASGRE
jgi:DNA-binding NtrC family response regulator